MRNKSEEEKETKGRGRLSGDGHYRSLTLVLCNQLVPPLLVMSLPPVRISGFGFRVLGFRFRVSGFGFQVLGFGSCFGFRVLRFWFLVSRFECIRPVRFMKTMSSRWILGECSGVRPRTGSCCRCIDYQPPALVIREHIYYQPYIFPVYKLLVG